MILLCLDLEFLKSFRLTRNHYFFATKTQSRKDFYLKKFFFSQIHQIDKILYILILLIEIDIEIDF